LSYETNPGFFVKISKPFFTVNCGGSQYTDKAGIVYQADNLFAGGQTYKTTAAIAGTQDGPLYQTERFGNFSYNIPVVNGNYAVTLKFAEIYNHYAGGRIFDVKIEGKEVISNLDIFAKAGKNKAYDVTIPVTVTDGMLNIEFRPDVGNAKVSAILVTPTKLTPQLMITATAGTGGTLTPQGSVSVNYGADQAFTIAPNSGSHISDVKVDTVSQGAITTYTFNNVIANHTIEAIFALDPPGTQPVFAVNCGGPQYKDPKGTVYQADTSFTGGQTYITPAAIAGTSDGTLYQSERFGNFSYNIPVPNGGYLVTLKFAEIYLNYAGGRIFDVKIEGQKIIGNLDIFAKAGKNKAYDVMLPVTVTDGVLNIEFITNVGSAKVSAILVTKP
ncbi:MAG: malectin, partial [Deltaproteobacteria bacterium]|nr:malectin [Deltaproteobacteria bacterium]